MAHIENKEFVFGTLKINAAVSKARADELENREVLAHDDRGSAISVDEEIYTHKEIVGINEVCFNANVGGDEPDWRPLEKGFDLQELFAERQGLQGRIKNLQMQIGRLKRKIETMGLVMDPPEEEGG